MKRNISLLACSALLVSQVSTASMYIDVGDNKYDEGITPFTDADTLTAEFTGFGFTGLLATSVYDFSDNSIFGKFYDTNIELDAAGVPGSGVPLSGSGNVDLVLPACASQCVLKSLDSLAPPTVTSDAEGFLNFWNLAVEYKLSGELTAQAGPVYDDGFLDVFFVGGVDDPRRKVLTLNVTGSEINLANLKINFDITFAEDNFLFVQNENGDFIDANDGTGLGNTPFKASLDTNVVPPVPTPSQLLLTGTCTDDEFSCSAVRQSILNGSIVASVPVPEPASIALISLGLFGLGITARRRR